MDGFDLGSAMLIILAARGDLERRMIINTVGPVWEGNQVWFVLGGGAIFAAWPSLYAVSFSGFYLAMMVVLLTFILRPVAFKFRSKMPNAAWRSTWDWVLALCGFVAALVMGVAVGNVLQGVPFYFDDTLRSFYSGTFWALLNPFAILCGLLSVSMLIMHGALYVACKTEAELQGRVETFARGAAVAVIIIFAVAGLWIAKGINGYVVTSAINTAGPSNPMYKTVAVVPGAWLHNYSLYPLMIAAPVLGFVGAFLALLFARINKLAIVMSALSIAGIILTVGFSMFPFILPSSVAPQASLLVWDASSSQLTLFIMLVATIIFLPIILAYTAWVYHVMRGKVSAQFIESQHSAY
jgi:cytochrome d ubiquinol oxidase subunit II